MELIGLNGLKGSGKNVVGEYLAREHGYEVASFAALLKKSAGALFGIDPAVWEIAKNSDYVYVEWNGLPDKIAHRLSARQFLQRYGTEAHRDVFGTDFWVDALGDQLRPDGRYAIVDARFDNELRFVRSLSGRNWCILRTTGTGAADEHASEAAPDYALIDAFIDNNSSIAELYGAVDAALRGEEHERVETSR